MDPNGPDPRDTYVVAVGIDQYAAGNEWDLAGPVDDAVRFVRFFLARDVPPERVTLMVTPEPDPGLVPPDVVVRPAARAAVRDMLLRQLPTRRESTLYVVWGGHGFVDTERRRRLYYADATDPDSGDLDLDSMLTTFASDLIPALNRQVWLIDVCQLRGPAGRLRRAGHETFPSGEPVAGRTQDVLFAAGVGQAAANLRMQRTGLFSREVLRLLASTDMAWPADPQALVAALRDRFSALRAGGLTRQTPTYLWYRDALGDEGLVLQQPASATGSRPASVEVPTSHLRSFVDALLEIPEFRRPNDREEILALLRSQVYAAIRRNPGTRLDAFSVVRTCLRYPGGLAELVEAVRFFATDDTAMEHLEAAATEFRAV